MHNFILETERLILRPLTLDDCDAVYKWVSDEDVTRYMVYNTYTSKEQVVCWLKSLEEDDDYLFGFVRKGTDDLIGCGSIGPHNGDRERWGFRSERAHV